MQLHAALLALNAHGIANEFFPNRRQTSYIIHEYPSGCRHHIQQHECDLIAFETLSVPKNSPPFTFEIWVGGDNIFSIKSDLLFIIANPRGDGMTLDLSSDIFIKGDFPLIAMYHHPFEFILRSTSHFKFTVVLKKTYLDVSLRAEYLRTSLQLPFKQYIRERSVDNIITITNCSSVMTGVFIHCKSELDSVKFLVNDMVLNAYDKMAIHQLGMAQRFTTGIQFTEDDCITLNYLLRQKHGVPPELIREIETYSRFKNKYIYWFQLERNRSPWQESSTLNCAFLNIKIVCEAQSEVMADVVALNRLDITHGIARKWIPQ